MKKTTKLIMLAISIAILAAVFMGISVSAADSEGALEIKSINISYKDRLELLVAVDIDNAERESIYSIFRIGGCKNDGRLVVNQF